MEGCKLPRASHFSTPSTTAAICTQRKLRYTSTHAGTKDRADQNLRETIEFDSISRNKSIPADFITKQKRDQGTITSAMASAIEMHSTWTSPLSTSPNHGGVQVRRFYNDYPAFTDMNNLSLVTLLKYEGCGIVVPSDLEASDWKMLLQNNAFCECLRKTSYFIASHHGRNEGYCEEVFQLLQTQTDHFVGQGNRSQESGARLHKARFWFTGQWWGNSKSIDDTKRWAYPNREAYRRACFSEIQP